MEVNNGKGLYDKYGMIDELQKKMDVLADAKGVFRCGLIWDMSRMLNALKNGMKNEDENTSRKIEAMKAQLQAMEKGENA